MSTSTCAQCGAPVLTARFRWSRAPATLDPDPCATGTVRLSADGATAEALTVAERAAHRGPLYRSHAASCSFAAEFRRRAAP